jgi:general L-amino acid transport system permease protein
MVSDSSGERLNWKALLRDERFWKIAFQVITLLVVIGIAAFLITNLNRNLARQGHGFWVQLFSQPGWL